MNPMCIQIPYTQFSLASCISEQWLDRLKIDLSSTPSENAKLENGSISKPSFFQRVRNAYLKAIRKFVKFLQKYELFATSLVLGTLLTELWPAFKAAFIGAAYYRKDFNYYHMNPKILTQEELNKQPILLIHGNYHNQSAWISLAKKLQLNYLGPVYTVNLPGGVITDKDYEILDEKMEEIKAQYKKSKAGHIKIHVIGHSRGGFLASEMAWVTLKKDQKGNRYWKRSEDIGKIITIGHPVESDNIRFIQKVDAN